jgi:hypothetical protein
MKTKMKPKMKALAERVKLVGLLEAALEYEGSEVMLHHKGKVIRVANGNVTVNGNGIDKANLLEYFRSEDV